MVDAGNQEVITSTCRVSGTAVFDSTFKHGWQSEGLKPPLYLIVAKPWFVRQFVGSFSMVARQLCPTLKSEKYASMIAGKGFAYLKFRLDQANSVRRMLAPRTKICNEPKGPRTAE